MIVWLASYPRSGNTLLRTLLKQTMDLASASDENEGSTAAGPNLAAFEQVGTRLWEKTWADFYREAAASPEIVPIKTHRPPVDDQPAIYVVRDGRRACLSYAHFHRSFSPPPAPSLLDVVLGDDEYGDWSSHYRNWAERPNTLVVRYEELVAGSPELLARLAARLGFAGTPRPWVNPFENLQQASPQFFRQGSTTWSGDAEWPAWLDVIFFARHGELMRELGYGEEAPAEADESVRQLLGKCRSLLADKRELRKVCDERLDLIEKLRWRNLPSWKRH